MLLLKLYEYYYHNYSRYQFPFILTTTILYALFTGQPAVENEWRNEFKMHVTALLISVV